MPAKKAAAKKRKKVTKAKADARKRSNANLKPFKPGQSGNPAGRPKGVRFVSEAMRDVLHKKAHELESTRNYCDENDLDSTQLSVTEVLAMKHFEEAFNGSSSFMQMLLDRVEGKLVDRLEARLDGKMSSTELLSQVLGVSEEGEPD